MFVQRLILQSYNISGMLHTTPPWASLTRQSRGGNICLWEDFLWQCRSLRSHPGHPAWWRGESDEHHRASVQVWTSPGRERDIETVRVVTMIAPGRCQYRHLGLVLWHNSDIVTLSRVPCDETWCQEGRAQHLMCHRPRPQAPDLVTLPTDELSQPSDEGADVWLMTPPGQEKLGIVSNTATI